MSIILQLSFFGCVLLSKIAPLILLTETNIMCLFYDLSNKITVKKRTTLLMSCVRSSFLNLPSLGTLGKDETIEEHHDQKKTI